MRRRPSVLAHFKSRLITCAATLPGWLGAASGCTFDPGHDYAVTSSWWLNGVSPDAARCKELGIAQFRLRMEGPGPAVTLEGDCADTLDIGERTYGGFQTTRSFDFGVVYSYSVEALDAQGKVTYVYPGPGAPTPLVSADYRDAVLVDGEPVVDLYTVDVFEPEGKTSSFSAAWVFSSGDLATDCQRNQISDVELWIWSATDPELSDPRVLGSGPCEQGELTSNGKVLARGNYYFMYVAFDARGGIAEQGDPIPAVVDDPGDLALPRHQFKGL